MIEIYCQKDQYKMSTIESRFCGIVHGCLSSCTWAAWRSSPWCWWRSWWSAPRRPPPCCPAPSRSDPSLDTTRGIRYDEYRYIYFLNKRVIYFFRKIWERVHKTLSRWLFGYQRPPNIILWKLHYREVKLTPLFLTYSCILLLDLLGEYIRQKLLHIDTIRVGVTEI